MDELKKYTTQQTGQFDDFDLDEVDKLRLWSDIVPDLPEKPKKIIPLWRKPAFRVAASIVLLLGCTLFFFMTSRQNLENQVVHEDLYEIDNHYKLLVSNQIELIKNNTHLSKADQEDFLSLIDDLDNEYETLKKELKLGINNQKIIEAIILNYRKKIQLMEDLLNRIYPIKNNFDDGELIL